MRNRTLWGFVALALSPAAHAGTHQPPSAIVQVWGGGRHTIALLADGSVWTWGSDVEGKLGDNQSCASYTDTSHDSHLPLKVHGPGNIGYLNSVVAISAGEGHNLALRSDGTVWAWGRNGEGQLGNGTTTDAYTPVQVSGLSNVVAISGRAYHCLALKSDGTVWAWGWNRYGQVGNGAASPTGVPDVDVLVPVQVVGLANPVAISAGYTVSLARMSDGTVRVWGTGLHGELGQGQFGDHSYTPIPIAGLSNVVSVAADFEEPNALKADGTMWMWGWNNLGQLGNGTTTDESLPGQVLGLANMTLAGATGDRNNCALGSDHTVWTWGRNYNGQLGIGTADQDPHPLPVQVPAFGTGGYVVYVQTPDWHSLALRSDGTLWAWGSNDHGQLGNDTTNDAYSPTEVLWPVVAPKRFYSLAPCRIVDTRNSSGPDAGAPSFSSGEVRIVPTAGKCGLPPTAAALVLNVTISTPAAPGYLTVYAADANPPPTSTINFVPGRVRASNAVLPVAVDGTGLKVANGSTGKVDVILDVTGYFE